MSARRGAKRPDYRVNLRLDYELDADLIAWVEGQSRGTLSQAIREALRRGLEAEQELHEFALDYEHIRRILADELARALAGLHLQTQQGEDGPTASDARGSGADGGESEASSGYL